MKNQAQPPIKQVARPALLLFPLPNQLLPLGPHAKAVNSSEEPWIDLSNDMRPCASDIHTVYA